MKKYTDTELLDFLQLLTNRANYSGRVVMRESYTGRGWRLHESTHSDSVTDVREAISKFLIREELNLAPVVELDDHREIWSHTSVKCNECDYKWEAVFPDGCDITALECPNCGRLNSSKRE